jgi:transposase
MRLSTEAPLDDLSREELIVLIRELLYQIAELKTENERLKRSHYRQAAPFSKGEPKPNPKKPGRKPGDGLFAHRSAPSVAATETVTATTPRCCPACGGELERVGEEVATTTDLPPNPRPVVTAYRVSVCHCRQCGKRVRGTAPGLAPDQMGATAHRVGPGLMAAAHALHYGIGVPVRKVPAILNELAGVAITQSALTQDAMRRAEGAVGVAYNYLRNTVREASVVHTDDTGWRIGGENAFLMGFDTDQSTIYQIRYQHRNEEVREIVPANYRGVLVSDRGKSYDAEELYEVPQQKCLAHLLRNVTDVMQTKQGRACQFGATLKVLLRKGLALWHARSNLSSEDFRALHQELDERLTYHLRNRILRDEDNQRLLDGIGLQHDRGSLLRFLETEGVEPTNNRAERILRPAVIARKVSQCSKNQRGADAFAAFLSIAQTARKTIGMTASQSFHTLFSGSVAAVAR